MVMYNAKKKTMNCEQSTVVSIHFYPFGDGPLRDIAMASFLCVRQVEHLRRFWWNTPGDSGLLGGGLNIYV